MRTISSDQITAAVRELCLKAAFELPEDLKGLLQRSLSTERSEAGRRVLEDILENARIAGRERLPLCQDTGLALFWVELGRDVSLTGCGLQQAVDQGVGLAYREGFLRKSVVRDPLRGENTGDNTPAFVHLEMTDGESVRIIHLPKGCGSENMSRLAMLYPSAGAEGVERLVAETVQMAGANACPPLIVGVGIGGNFETAPRLAKKALLRNAGQRNPDPYYASMESRLLEGINLLGIGPGGLGGSTTALEVFIEVHPCHMASLPVAVNLQCHAARRAFTVL